MEKTDTIILSPEELAAYMAESTISVTSTYEHSPVILMVDDTVIGTLGNFSASIGKAKSKKTFNVSAIVASALSGSTVLHYRSMFPENKRKILYIDTEQGRYHCQQVLKRILRLADLPEYKNPDNLIMLALRKFSPKLRLAIVEQAIGTIPDSGMASSFMRKAKGSNSWSRIWTASTTLTVLSSLSTSTCMMVSALLLSSVPM